MNCAFFEASGYRFQTCIAECAMCGFPDADG